MKKLHTYGMQILFVLGIAVGSKNFYLEDNRNWLNVVRCVVYLLTLKTIPHICTLAQKFHTKGHMNLHNAVTENRMYFVVYICSLLILEYFRERTFREDFLYIGLAYIVVKYPEMATKPSINYGVGMACSLFEGYLIYILPSDGAHFVGFENNVITLQEREGVLFPVKKLFVIITKNLYSPPDLKDFNKKDGTYLEAFNVLKGVRKSVAGVKDRIYLNTAYKIYRPHAPPVCLVAECATPLHTLHRVLNNRALYQEVADIDVAEVVSDFCTTLQSILDKSPECRGKCELVYYDNEDPTQNLAEILLDRIKTIVPDFEEKIIARREDNVLEQQDP